MSNQVTSLQYLPVPPTWSPKGRSHCWQHQKGQHQQLNIVGCKTQDYSE